MCRRCPKRRPSQGQELLTWLREALKVGTLQSSVVEDVRSTTSVLLGQSGEKASIAVNLETLKQAGASEEELSKIEAMLSTSNEQPN